LSVLFIAQCENADSGDRFSQEFGKAVSSPVGVRGKFTIVQQKLTNEVGRCRKISTTSKATQQSSIQENTSIKACKLDTYQSRSQSNPSKKRHL